MRRGGQTVAAAPLIGRAEEFAACMDALENRRSVVIVGSPGIGKSAFLSHAAEVSDRRSARLVSSPHGAYLDIAGESPVAAAELAHASRASASDGRDGSLLVFVDDADALESQTLAPLLDAAAQRTAQLVLASGVTPAEAAPRVRTKDLLTRFWSGGHAERIDLSPLTRADSDLMLRILAAPDTVEEPWVDMFHRLSGGSPVLLRALLTEATQRGDLLRPAPLSPGPLPFYPSRAALELLGPQMDGLPERAVASLAVLARIRRLSLQRAHEMLPAADLALLIERGLVHTMYGTDLLQVPELMITATERLLSPERWAEASLEAVAVLSDTAAAGAPLTDEEALFLAAGLLDRRLRERVVPVLTEPGVRRAVLRGARLYSRADDPETAARLVRQLLRIDDEPVARVVLARAQAALHDHDGAAETLESLEPPVDVRTGRSVLAARHHIMLWHLGDATGFVDYLDRAESWFPGDASWQRAIAFSRTATQVFRLRGVPADDLADVAPPAPSADERMLLNVLTAATGGPPAQTLTTTATRWPGDPPAQETFSGFMAGAALRLLSAEIEGLVETYRRALQRASAEHRLMHLVLLSWLDAHIRLEHGDIDGAIRALRRYLLPSVPEMARATMLVEIAWLCARTGDIDAAEEAYQEAAACRLQEHAPWYTMLLELAACELLLAHGQREDARDRAIAAVDRSAQCLPVLMPVFAEVAQRARTSDGTLTELLRSLGPVPDDIAGRAAGGPREGARPVADHPALEPLTARERELVQLATSGMSNQQIAQELHLSVRTVESHLHHARAKLGLSGRQSLWTLVEPARARR